MAEKREYTLKTCRRCAHAFAVVVRSWDRGTVGTCRPCALELSAAMHLLRARRASSKIGEATQARDRLVARVTARRAAP